jgi:hypothetical protein
MSLVTRGTRGCDEPSDQPSGEGQRHDGDDVEDELGVEVVDHVSTPSPGPHSTR